jgi:hypothetical protein
MAKAAEFAYIRSMSYTLELFGPRLTEVGIRNGLGKLHFEAADDVAAIATMKKLFVERLEEAPYARLVNENGKWVWESGPWDT